MTRLRDVLSAIDAANAADPVRVVVDGSQRPGEVHRAELATAWARRLCPDASEALLIAVRAHHVQRWRWPRDGHPPGRAGYLRWRHELQERHVEIVSTIMDEHGYASGKIDGVGALMRKRDLGTDAEAGTYEDALALTFVETQLRSLAARTPRDKMVAILRKTIGKMSAAGRDAIEAIDLGVDEHDLLEAALAAHHRGVQPD